jgi:anti-anti-sigma factor
MKITCAEENGVVKVDVEGRAAHGEIDPMKEPVKAQLGEDVYQKKLIFNLGRTEYVDSAGISWLLVCHKRVREAGGKMVIHSVPPMIRQVFEVLRMNLVFNLADDAKAAQAMLQGGG